MTPAPPPAERAVHLRPAFVVVVAAGGAVGTATREGIALVVPEVAGFPVAVLGINVVGAFVLGLLLESLLIAGPDTGRRRMLRLLAGTGFCGGFTTYSALATASAGLAAGGAVGAAVLYGLLTVAVGGIASWAGIATGSLRARRVG